MGAYLSVAKTEKTSSDGESDVLKYGASAMQGWRREMEDAHTTILDFGTDTAFFAVYDGHGGKEVARFCARHLHEELLKTEEYRKGDMAEALIKTYLRMDEIMMLEESRDELRQLATDASVTETPRRTSLPTVTIQHRDQGTAANGPAAFDLPHTLQNGLLGGAGHLAGFETGTIEDLERGSGGGIETDSAEATNEEKVESSHGRAVGRADVASEVEANRHVYVDEVYEEDEALVEQVSFEEATYEGPTAGCTAVSALISGGRIIVANAGDSRCVLSRNGHAVEMSKDHKPDLEEEKSRIVKADGFVEYGRVNGSLALSRAIGDMEYKRNDSLEPSAQIVTAHPDIRTTNIESGDEFLILACDGIWDVCSSQDAVDFVRQRLLKDPSQRLSGIVEDLFEFCLAPDSTGNGLGMDNMSAVIVLLKKEIKDRAAKRA